MPGSSPFLFSVESIAAFSKSLAEYIRISHPQSRHLNAYRPDPTKRTDLKVSIYMQKLNAFLLKIMVSQNGKLLGPMASLFGCLTALPLFQAADVRRRFMSCVPVPGMLRMCIKMIVIISA